MTQKEQIREHLKKARRNNILGGNTNVQYYKACGDNPQDPRNESQSKLSWEHRLGKV